MATEDVILRISADVEQLLREFARAEERWSQSVNRLETEGDEAFDGLVADARAGADALRELAGTADKNVAGFERIDRKLEEVDAELTDLEHSIARMGRGSNRSLNEVEGSVKRVDKALVSAGRAVKLFIAGFIVNQLRQFVSEALNVATSFESIETALKNVSGSQERFLDNQRFLAEEADRLGLALRESTQDFTKLSAAARGTALAGEDTRQIFLGVAEAGRALGLSQEQISGLLTAFEQIISKGTVSAEELRGQLGERIPGAFQLAAAAIGVTTEELGKMLQRGELMAEELLPKLAEQMRSTFGEAAQENARKTAAAQERITTSVEKLQRTFGEGLQPAIRKVADVFDELSDEDSGFSKIVRRMGELAGDVAAAGADFLDFINDVSELSAEMLEGADATDVFLVRFAQFNEALANSPLNAKSPDAIDPSLLEGAMQRLREELDPTAKSIIQLGVSMRGVKADFEKLGLATEQELVKAIGNIRAYEEEVSTAADGTRNLGQVTEEQAELIVSEIESILDSIRQLPPEQQQAFEVAAGVVETLRTEYERLLEEIEKQPDAQKELADAIREVEKATDSFKDSVAGNRDELEKQTKAILAGVEALKAEGRITKEVTANISEEIAKLLEQYEEFGLVAPEALRALAAEYPPLIEETDKLAESTAKADKSLEGLVKTAESAPERIKKTKDALDDYQNVVDRLGENPFLIAPEDLDRLSDAERELFFAKSSTEDFTQSQEDLGQAVDDAQVSFQAQNDLLSTLQDNFGLSADEARKAANEILGLNDAAEGIGDGVEAEQLLKVLKEIEDQAERTKTAVAGIFQSNNRASALLDTLTAIKLCLAELAKTEL